MQTCSDSSQKTLTAKSEDVKDGSTGASILAGDCRGAMMKVNKILMVVVEAALMMPVRFTGGLAS